jgi:3-hydroxyisobutyrate dehydrogenase
VAVIGAGIMGPAMARNLVAAGLTTLAWALKDVDLAIGAARGGTLPLLAALSGRWHTAVAAGHGRQDISAARLALGSPSRTS